MTMHDLDGRLASAVRSFWKTREHQDKKQGGKGGRRDAGARSSVTGGKQMDGFRDLVRDLLIEAGIPEPSIFRGRGVELPGFYRPEKRWDLLVVAEGKLLATIELKSQVGSFGNNHNNRTEEAIGNAVDLRTAYRDGAFKPSPDPWAGYMVLLEDAPKSQRPVRVKEPHFAIFEEFHGASYAQRYELLLLRLVRERLYDGACLLLSGRSGGRTGDSIQPNEELSFRGFVASLVAHASAFSSKARR